MPARAEDIPQFVKTMKVSQKQRAYDHTKSIFSKWRQDTTSSLNFAFREDIKLWKGFRFIKDEDDRTATENVLNEHYKILKEVYTNAVSMSSYPSMTAIEFAEWGVRSKLQDDQNVNLAAFDRAYIAATLKLNPATDPPNITRFEFLEILVRLADIKFIQTKQIKTYPDATRKIIEDFIIKNFHPTEPWQEFRDKELWTLDVHDLFKANTQRLEVIYRSFLSGVHKAMDLKDCQELCMRDENLGVGEKDVTYAYGMSKATIGSEIPQYAGYMKLDYTEFLEFLARIATAKARNNHAPQSMPLTQKIEEALDDILGSFGMVRNEVKIEDEEISEEDDDY